MAEEVFNPFEPTDPPNPAGSKPKPTRKASGKKASAKKPARKKAAAPLSVATEADVKAAVKPARKKRVVKDKAVRAVKMELSAMLSAFAGLKEDEAKYLAKMVSAMQTLKKGPRARIVAALGKVFA